MSEGLHVFFDTTEVAGPPGWAKLGRIASERLLTAAGAIGATLYVPQLVIDEVVYRRFRHFKKQLKDFEAAKKVVEKYIPVGVENVPGDEVMIVTFRKEAQEQLSQIPVKIIPLGLVSLEEILSLSLSRVAPFSKTDDPTGFHDAVILLSVLKYAQANGLKECHFVSNDRDYVESEVGRLAKQYAVECRLWTSAEDIAELMEKLQAMHIRTLAETIFRAVTEFVNANRVEIEKYLNEHPLKVRDFVFGLGTTPVQVLSIVVNKINALPDTVPQEGEECAIHLSVTVVGEFVVDVITFQESPEQELEVRADLIIEEEVKIGEPIFTRPPRSLVARQRESRMVEARLVGRARAKFQGGRFIKPLIVESLEVRRGFASLLTMGIHGS